MKKLTAEFLLTKNAYQSKDLKYNLTRQQPLKYCLTSIRGKGGVDKKETSNDSATGSC